MTTFAVTDPSHTVAALNYVLSNLGQGGGGGDATGNVLTVNTTTGVISLNGSTTVQAYYYQYINIRYADTASGSGFSTSPTNKLYYGILNTNASTPTNVNNPTSYQWELVTGGFGTTKFLYYSTFGGRQVQFTAATSIPNVFYSQAVDNTPINLDFVTSTQALPTVVLTIYQRATSAPATPTGGTYNFDTLVLTPPSGWSASIPSGTDAYYTSQNTFTAAVTGTTSPPDLAWTTPVLSGGNGTSVYLYTVFQQSATQPSRPGADGSYNFGTATGTPPVGWTNTPISTTNSVIWSTTASSYSNIPGGTWTANSSSWSNVVQYTGAGGATGERGFIPMAYVLTTQNPLISPGNTTANLSSSFSAARTNSVAPIGTGYAPEAGDTASFTWTSNTAVNTVYTFNGTIWQAAAGQVINGNVFVTGSVNANAMNANDIYALTMRGGNVTPGTFSGTGYWLQASTGNAYIGGNLVIGNNANIGNNLTIGNSVTIGGLTLNGNLLANTVTATSITPGSVIAGKLGSNAVIAGDIANGAVTYGALAANSIQANAIAANTISGDIIIANTLSGNSIVTNTLSGNAIIANTIAGNTIIANTLYGNSIIAGTLQANALVANSITATQISTAYVYAGNITSFGATQGNTSSLGYWLAYNSGDARFGGNVSIGANLNVSGLITTGALNSNTVITTTMQPSTVSNFQAAAGGAGTGYVVVTNPVSGTAYATDMSVNLTTTQANQPVYIYAGMQTFWNSINLAANSEVVLAVSLFRNSTGIITDNYTFDSGPGGGSVNFQSQTNFTGFTDAPPTPGTYNYYLSVAIITTVGSYSGGNISVGFRNITTQTLKR